MTFRYASRSLNTRTEYYRFTDYKSRYWYWGQLRREWVGGWFDSFNDGSYKVVELPNTLMLLKGIEL